MPTNSKRTSQAEDAAKEVKEYLYTIGKLVDRIIESLAPVDKRGENIEPRQRAAVGLKPKRKG